MSDDVLGDLSVARVRDDEGALEQIAELTSLTPRTIRRRLEGAHGKTLVHNVFDDEWPNNATALGVLRAKQARDVGLFVEIAGVTGLTERTVRVRLADAHHRASVKTVFAADWPREQEQEPEPEPEQDDGDAPPAGIDVRVGSMTTAQARNDEDAVACIAALTGRSERTVRRRLADATGMMLVRNVFAADWPTSVAALAERTVADDEEETDDPVDAEAPDDADPATDVVAAFRLAPDGAWSRPRQLARVLRKLGTDVPQRLRTTRFQAVLSQLEQSGIQMRLADEDEPLPTDATSPGIDARVCLRTVNAFKAAAAELGFAAGALTEPSRRPAPPRVNAPSSTPPPIVVVAAPRQPPRPPPPPPRDSDYELALLRLQFLTAVPSMDRQREPEWPEDFLAAATDGLTVTAGESRLLRTVAASFVRGGHNPSPFITGLVKAEAHHDLDALLARFRHLNRHMADAATEILRWVDELREGHHPRPPPPVHAPSPPAHPPAARAASSRTPAPAPPRAPAAAKPAHEEAHANVRGLGALDDMFKD